MKSDVLAEFNHRCAVCGADRPHLHHLDEDPSNNDLLNLIPLCPNCHLTDQHNPTHAIPAAILQLFRVHKDPVLLSPQFRPLHDRFAFLNAIADSTDVSDLEARVRELVLFVRALKMGRFYGDQLYNLLNFSGTPQIYFADEGADQEIRLSDAAAFRRHLRASRPKVLTLIVELLRYQEWPAPKQASQRP